MNENLLDLGREYDAMLNKGIKLSGEDKHFFTLGRIQDLKRQLPSDFRPQSILDFGCGIGDTTRFLSDTFPGVEIIGVDVSEEALSYADEKYGAPCISFYSLNTFSRTDAIDLCYTNGVFHHIPPADRLGTVAMIRDALVTGGYFALFENNPWNLGTRLVMRRIPFDRDAQPLSPLQTRHLLREGGFSYCAPTRFLFYFPRPLAFLRFIEPWLARLPFGAQYYVLAVK